MRAAGLRGRQPRGWRKTTIAGQRSVDAPDLIGQDFTAAMANTRWCGDITYVAHIPVDRRLLQPPATTLHTEILDTPRI
jgi:transposase InsO family protein